MMVSLIAESRFPTTGQQGHGSRNIHPRKESTTMDVCARRDICSVGSFPNTREYGFFMPSPFTVLYCSVIFLLFFTVLELFYCSLLFYSSINMYLRFDLCFDF